MTQIHIRFSLRPDEGLVPVMVILLGIAFVLITFPVDAKEVFTLLDVLNIFSPFSKLKLLFLFESPGDEERNVAFPVRALLSNEPVAVPSSSSSSPCSSSDEEAAVDESSSPSSGLKEKTYMNLSQQGMDSLLFMQLHLSRQ